MDQGTTVISARLNLLAGDYHRQTYGEDLTREGYVKDAVQNYRNVFPDFNFIESSLDVTLAGQPAYRLSYSIDGGRYVVMETGTIIKDGKYQNVYQINYMASFGMFLTNWQIARSMIESVKIGEPHSIPTSYSSNTLEDMHHDGILLPIVHTLAHKACEGAQM